MKYNFLHVLSSQIAWKIVHIQYVVGKKISLGEHEPRTPLALGLPWMFTTSHSKGHVFKALTHETRCIPLLDAWDHKENMVFSELRQIYKLIINNITFNNVKYKTNKSTEYVAAGLDASAMQQIIMNLNILKSQDLRLGAGSLLILNTAIRSRWPSVHGYKVYNGSNWMKQQCMT